MTRTALMLSTAAVAALSIAGPALADLTADDVWASWQETAASTGQTIEVAEIASTGDRLTLDGVNVSMEMPDGGVVTTVDRIVFAEQGDGSVAIEVSPEYNIRVESMSPEDEAMVMEMILSHTDLAVLATGDPDAISYAYAAPALELRLDSMTVDGEPADMTLAVGVEGLEGSYDVIAGDPQQITSVTSAAAVAMTVAMTEPEENVDFDMALTMQGLNSTSSGSLSPFNAGQDLAQMLRSGLTTEGRVTYGATAYSIDGTDQDGQFIVEGSADSGSLDIELAEDGIVYGGGNTGVALSVVAPGAMMPPINVDIAESEGRLTIPLLSTEAAQDFGLVMRLRDVTVGDMVWSMIDPTGGLPREPANLTLDISGKGNWFTDIVDPEAMAAMEGDAEMPGQVESVDVNEMELSVVGAELTGSGAFTFDNSSNPPTPAGTMNLRLEGGNALIDRLVAIGLIPEDQATGARMMLGLFAQPGEGEDTLVSTIEVKEDGSVIANGQRIR